MFWGEGQGPMSPLKLTRCHCLGEADGRCCKYWEKPLKHFGNWWNLMENSWKLYETWWKLMEIKMTFTNLIHDVLHQQYLSMLVIQHGIKNDRLCHEEYLLRPLAGFCSQKASMYACCMVNDSVGWARDPETTLNLNPMPVNHLTMISMDFGSRSMFTLEFLAQGRPFYSRQDSLPRNGVTPRWNRGDLSRSCYFEVVRTNTQADT